MSFNPEDLEISQVQSYRSKLFATSLHGQLTVENTTQWLREEPFRMFMALDVQFQPCPSTYKVQQLKRYREFLLPEGLHHDRAFTTDQVADWVCEPALKMFLKSLEPKPETPLTAPPDVIEPVQSEIAEIFKFAQRSLIHMVQTDDGSEVDPTIGFLQSLPSFTANQPLDSLNFKSRGDEIVLNRKLRVDRIYLINQPLAEYPIPCGEKVAFLLDYTNCDLFKKLDIAVHTVIRKQTLAAWKTVSAPAATKSEGEIPQLFGPMSTPFGVATLQCLGVKACEYFTLADDYVRDGFDRETTQEIRKQFLRANQNEWTALDGKALRQYSDITSCECGGYPVLLSHEHQSSRSVIGCSNVKDPEYAHVNHRTQTIRDGVPVDRLSALIESAGHYLHNEHVNIPCPNLLHHSTHMTTCTLSHVKDSRILPPGEIVNRPCGCILKIYIPQDRTIKRALIVQFGSHNHPSELPGVTPTLEQEHSVEQLAAELKGPLRPSNIRKAPQPNGQPFEKNHPAYANNSKLRSKVQGIRKKNNISNDPWAAATQMFNAQPKANSTLGSLPSYREPNYIRTLTLRPEFRFLTTMHRCLAQRVHELPYFVCDTTFKTIKGEIELHQYAGMDSMINSRIILGTTYFTSHKTEHFEEMFTTFDDNIKQTTDASLGWRELHPANPNNNLRGVVMDGEKSQIQGFANYIAKKHDPNLSGLHNITDPVRLAFLFIKICRVHFERNIDDMKTLPESENRRLKSFPNLKRDAIRTWIEACENSPYEQVQNWFKDKRWGTQDCLQDIHNEPILDSQGQTIPDPGHILRSLNRETCLMDKDTFDILPQSSNLIESAHVERNANGIGFDLCTGINTFREQDEQKVAKLEVCETSGVLPNERNNVRDRERINDRRRANNARHQQSDRKDMYDLQEFQQEIDSFQTKIRESQNLDRLAKDEVDTLKKSKEPADQEKRKKLQEEMESRKDQRRRWKRDKDALKTQPEYLALQERRKGKAKKPRRPTSPVHASSPSLPDQGNAMPPLPAESLPHADSPFDESSALNRDIPQPTAEHSYNFNEESTVHAPVQLFDDELQYEQVEPTFLDNALNGTSQDLPMGLFEQLDPNFDELAPFTPSADLSTPNNDLWTGLQDTSFYQAASMNVPYGATDNYTHPPSSFGIDSGYWPTYIPNTGTSLPEDFYQFDDDQMNLIQSLLTSNDDSASHPATLLPPYSSASPTLEPKEDAYECPSQVLNRDQRAMPSTSPAPHLTDFDHGQPGPTTALAAAGTKRKGDRGVSGPKKKHKLGNGQPRRSGRSTSQTIKAAGLDEVVCVTEKGQEEVNEHNRFTARRASYKAKTRR